MRSVIVITGDAASGKTSLARRIAYGTVTYECIGFPNWANILSDRFDCLICEMTVEQFYSIAANELRIKNTIFIKDSCSGRNEIDLSKCLLIITVQSSERIQTDRYGYSFHLAKQ